MSSEPPSTRSVVQAAVWSAATAWSFYLMAKFVNHRWHVLRLEKEAEKMQKLLDHERRVRRAERQGRVRAEQELRKHQLAAVAEAGAAAAAAGAAAAATEEDSEGMDDDAAFATQASPPPPNPNGTPDTSSSGTADRGAAVQSHAAHSSSTTKPATAPGLVFPVRPIGTVQSCFSQRNGTPRQPLLVPLARCRIQLAPDVPGATLSGLEQYSHVWVIYVFHENTNLVKLWQGDRSGIKAKIHVPRLNGEKMGVLATRSPHRPVPIGLSVAQVVSVDGSGIVLAGADIVDGSPVLDIKPYLPFCDAVHQASAPAWVKAEAEDEPLHVSHVDCSSSASSLIQLCWSSLYGQGQRRSLYRSCEEFMDLVRQVLSRDIRPVHRRIQSPLWADVPRPPPSFYGGTQLQLGAYHVVLEHIDVSYDISEEGRVVLRGACPNTVQSQQRGLGVLA